MKPRNASDLFEAKLCLGKVWVRKQKGTGASLPWDSLCPCFIWQTLHVSAHFQLKTKRRAWLHVLFTTIYIKYFLWDDAFVICDPHALSAKACTRPLLHEQLHRPLGE